MVTVMYSMKAEKALLDKARELKINISKASRDGIQAAIEREEKIKVLLGDDY